MPHTKIKKILFISVATVVVLFVAMMIISMSKQGESALSVMVKNARYSATCEKMIPMQDMPGYPIPFKTMAGEKIYQIFFFGLNRSYPSQSQGEEPKLLAPGAVAEIRADGTSSCSPFLMNPTFKPTNEYGPRFSAEANKLSMGSFDSYRNDLFLATEKTAQFYFSKDESQNAKDTANDYFNQFTYLSEPGFKQFYYDLNPDFWQWVEKLTGKKLLENSASVSEDGITEGLDKVPKEAQALLPKHGLLAVSGGLLSSSRRVIVDLDKKILIFSENPTPNTSVYSAQLKENQFALTNEQAGKISSLMSSSLNAGNIVRRPPPPDFSIILFLTNDTSVQRIDSFGQPDTDPASQLYEYIWTLIDAQKKSS